MIKSKLELFDALKSEGIPLDFEAVWNNTVPEKVRYICQAPDLMFEAFLRAPEMFPFPNELLVLWETNSNSIVGYLRRQGKYIRYYVEDGPGDYEEIGETYQQMISDLFGKLISRGVGGEDLRDLADFFNFEYLVELVGYVKNNSDWEENTAAFISSIEKL